MRTVLSNLGDNQARRPSMGTKAGQPSDVRMEAKRMMDLVKSLTSQMSAASNSYFLRAINSNIDERKSKRKRGASADLEPSSSPSKKLLLAKLDSPFDVNWDAVKSWPKGAAEELKAMSDYLRRLKMIHIEQETKNLFLHTINDETQIVFTAAKVLDMEAEAQELKAILRERKGVARSIQKEIEALAEELQAYDELQKNLASSRAFTEEIKEMEIELEILKNKEGRHGGGFVDYSGSITAPKRGEVTQEQAQDIAQRQIEAMESLGEEQDKIVKATEAAKKQLIEGALALDQLDLERKRAEEMAKAAQSRRRDLKSEAACQSHFAKLAVLKSLLGLLSIEAPSANSLQCTYRLQSDRMRAVYSQVIILVHFTDPTGSVEGYEIRNAADDQVIRLPPQSRIFPDNAVAANDAALLIQELLVCVERTVT